MDSIVVGGHYMHYKQKPYRVLSIARHSETLEEMVIYEALYENKLGQLWARPKAMFLETVEIGGRRQPRFQLSSSPLVKD